MTVLTMTEFSLLLVSMACYLDFIKHQVKAQGITMAFSEATSCGLGEVQKPGICPKESPD